jgi:hypothetical protein
MIMRYFLLVCLILSIVTVVTIAQDDEPTVPVFPFQLIAPMEADELAEWIASIDPILEEQSRNWYVGVVSNNATSTRVTWFEACCKGVVTIEEIRFCCITQIDPYFHYDEDMLPYYEFMLANYSPYELVQSCEVNGIHIHTFKGHSGGYDYYIQHYHAEHGLTTVNTGFYFRRLSQLEQYTQLFFPDLACPAGTQASEDSF